MKSFKERLLDGSVLWGHDEMLEWYIRNVRLRADFFDLEKENWYPAKPGRYQKIDGFMAMMDAYVVHIADDSPESHLWDDSHMISMSL